MDTIAQLTELPDLYAQLALLKTTMTPGVELGGGGPAITAKAPLRLEVMDLLGEAMDALHEWAKEIGHAIGESPPSPWMSSTCWWIRWAYPAWDGDKESFSITVNTLYTSSRALLGEREEVKPTHDCGHPMERVAGTLMECSGCGDRVDVGRGIEKVADEGYPVTLSQAAELLGRPLSTLKSWIKEGEIQALSDTRPRTYSLKALKDRSLKERTWLAF